MDRRYDPRTHGNSGIRPAMSNNGLGRGRPAKPTTSSRQRLANVQLTREPTTTPAKNFTYNASAFPNGIPFAQAPRPAGNPSGGGQKANQTGRVADHLQDSDIDAFDLDSSDSESSDSTDESVKAARDRYELEAKRIEEFLGTPPTEEDLFWGVEGLKARHRANAGKRLYDDNDESPPSKRARASQDGPAPHSGQPSRKRSQPADDSGGLGAAATGRHASKRFRAALDAETPSSDRKNMEQTTSSSGDWIPNSGRRTNQYSPAVAIDGTILNGSATAAGRQRHDREPSNTDVARRERNTRQTPSGHNQPNTKTGPDSPNRTRTGPDGKPLRLAQIQRSAAASGSAPSSAAATPMHQPSPRPPQKSPAPFGGLDTPLRRDSVTPFSPKKGQKTSPRIQKSERVKTRRSSSRGSRVAPPARASIWGYIGLVLLAIIIASMTYVFYLRIGGTDGLGAAREFLAKKLGLGWSG
ncbi:hypothetical protein QBC47DRAFT_356959 [Echria macrotheca]|uniref:Uncharacterized protein n=1 Tax=Echria macrotheca TaxID=438768 RepID=A0AAJ0BL18_9PEZI|nr:hypothetical protein QBC47DRAFT_356959 [Echria macrotheca]